MRAEAQEEAETALAKTAQSVRDTIGLEPETVIREGKAAEQIVNLIEEDRDIAILQENEPVGPVDYGRGVAGNDMLAILSQANEQRALLFCRDEDVLPFPDDPDRIGALEHPES